MESRTQGSRPRPRTQKKSEAKAKDRNARGQGQGPRTQAQVLSKKKKGLHKNFLSDLQKKKGLHKNFSSDLHKKPFSKKIFKRFTKFKQFKKYCCSRAEDRPIFEHLRPRGQGQGLDLRGQGLQNVSSRTSSRPRTSSRTPPLSLTVV